MCPKPVAHRLGCQPTKYCGRACKDRSRFARKPEKRTLYLENKKRKRHILSDARQEFARNAMELRALELRTLELENMSPNEFRDRLARYEMTIAGFARCSGWNRMSASRCLHNENRPIPGPVIAFMDMLDNVPAALEHARKRAEFKRPDVSES